MACDFAYKDVTPGATLGGEYLIHRIHSLTINMLRQNIYLGKLCTQFSNGVNIKLVVVEWNWNSYGSLKSKKREGRRKKRIDGLSKKENMELDVQDILIVHVSEGCLSADCTEHDKWSQNFLCFDVF